MTSREGARRGAKRGAHGSKVCRLASFLARFELLFSWFEGKGGRCGVWFEARYLDPKSDMEGEAREHRGQYPSPLTRSNCLRLADS